MVQLTNGIRGAVISPILALFIHEQGFTLTEIGLLGTAGVLGWFIFEPLMGVFADRLNKKYLISFAIIGSSIIYGLYPTASSFLHYSLLAFGLSSVMSAYAISVKALAAELIPKENRGKTYGRYTAVTSMGGILGPIIGGYIAEQMGNSVPFYIAAPKSTFDLSLKDGSKIPIEQRHPEEVSNGFGPRIAPKGVQIYNPAFDVTPAKLITGIITEYGIIEKPTTTKVKQALNNKQ